MSVQKSVLITGCSDGGLGAALAIELHSKGYRVFATARNISKMTTLPSDMDKLALEVTSESSIRECAAEIKKRTGGTLNMLINNAGVWQAMPVADLDLQAARTVFDINFWATLQITQIFLPFLLAAREQVQRATVVLAGSVAGVNVTPFTAIYGASKAAASYLMDAVRMELAPWGIEVIELKTGAVRSNMTINLRESGAQKPLLPSGSLYAVAKENVEKFMSGQSADAGTDQNEWARMVVQELRKKSPPKYIWGGTYAFMGWVAQFLPASLMRGMLEKVTGLDKVAQAVAGKKGQSESAK